MTPSGYNAQPWSFVLVREQERLQQIQKIAFHQKHITGAGNMVVVLGDTAFGDTEHDRIIDEWKMLRGYSEDQIQALSSSLKKTRSEAQWREMTLRSCSMAAMSFLYAAAAHGWSTCPMMGFSQRKLKKLLEVPDTHIPILLIALGKENLKMREAQLPRKTVQSLWHAETYTQKA